MNLDIETLQKELQDINQKKEYVSERLRGFGRGGRGRGRGPILREPFPQRGPPFHGGGEQFSRDYMHPQPSSDNFSPRGERFPGRDRFNQDQGPPSGRFPPPRGSGFHSAPPLRERFPQDRFPQDRFPRDRFPDRLANRLGPAPQQNQLRGGDADRPANEVDAVPVRKRLSSAVMVNGEQRVPGQDAVRREVPGVAKRPRPDDNDAPVEVKKRNARMFGALLGHLSKSRVEGQELQRSSAAQLRLEAEQRAAKREQEEQRKLREQRKVEVIAERQKEVIEQRRLTMEAEMKQLELQSARRVLRQETLSNFILTKTHPPLMWVPGTTSAATKSLLDARQTELTEWTEVEAQKLARNKAAIQERIDRLLAPKPANGRAVGGHVDAKEETAAAAEDEEMGEEGEAGDEEMEDADAGEERSDDQGPKASSEPTSAVHDGNDRWNAGGDGLDEEQEEGDSAEDIVSEVEEEVLEGSAEPSKEAVPEDPAVGTASPENEPAPEHTSADKAA